MCTHRHVHIQVCTQTCTHTENMYTQTCMHTGMYTYRKHVYAQTCTHILDTYTYRKPVHTDMYAHRYIHKETCTHTENMYTWTCTHRDYTHRHIYTQACTYTDMYTHRHVHTHTLQSRNGETFMYCRRKHEIFWLKYAYISKIPKLWLELHPIVPLKCVSP